MTLSYVSNGSTYALNFGGDFHVNGEFVDINYPRYDSPYVQAKKKDKTITYYFNEESLFLDFNNMIREF